VAWGGVGLRARDGKWYWFLIGHDAVFTNRDASHGSAVYAALLLRFSQEKYCPRLFFFTLGSIVPIIFLLLSVPCTGTPPDSGHVVSSFRP
jgi:hypothetical protein